MPSKLKKILEEGLIKEVLEVEPLFDSNNEVLKDVTYLTQLTEDTIYENYREAIAYDHTRPFLEFT